MALFRGSTSDPPVLGFPHLPVADAAHRRQLGREPVAPPKLGNFVFKTQPQHLVKTHCDLGVQNTVRAEGVSSQVKDLLVVLG